MRFFFRWARSLSFQVGKQKVAQSSQVNVELKSIGKEKLKDFVLEARTVFGDNIIGLSKISTMLPNMLNVRKIRSLL